MPHDFDPYYKWLGIPSKDQPPNHYRLLGIERFEADWEVIDAAANRIMAYLKSLATGEATDLSQKLLNEVAAARECLLNPQRKTAYDGNLACAVAESRLGQTRDATSPAPATVPAPPPLPPPLASPAPPLITASASQRPPHRLAANAPAGPLPPGEHSHPKSHTTLWIGGLLGACLLLITLLVVSSLMSSSRQSEGPHSRAGAPAKAPRDGNRGAARPASARLILKWPAGDRARAIVRIDGKEAYVPPLGSVEYPLSPGAHRLEIERKDDRTIRKRIVLSPGQDYLFEVQWQPETSDPAFSDFAALVQQPLAETPEAAPLIASTGEKTPEGPQPAVEEPQDKQPDGRPAKPQTATKKASDARKPPDPRNAFEKLPAAVDLPQLTEKSAGKPLAIGPIDAQEGDPLQLELLDGETVFKSGAKTTREFLLVPEDPSPAKASWLVQLTETSGETTSKQDNVARFWREQNVVKFQWAEGLDHRLVKRANHLRCCLVRLSLAEQEHQMALLTPTQSKPFTIDLQQIVMREQVPLKWLPDPDDLLVEITKLEGHEGCRFQQEEPARSWALVFLRKGLTDIESSEVQFQFSLAAQTSAVCMLRLVSPPLEFWRDWLPAKNPGSGGRKRPLVERYNRDELQRARDEAKTSYSRARSEKTKQPHFLAYEAIDRQLWYLTFCETVHQKAKVHYRIFFTVGQREVVLATTTP